MRLEAQMPAASIPPRMWPSPTSPNGCARLWGHPSPSSTPARRRSGHPATQSIAWLSPRHRSIAIEFDDGRAEKLHKALPEAHVLAPASFFGCRAGCNSFSFAWTNPPFDSAYGGHRVEEQFLTMATDWLMPGGVMAFVCPEDVIDEYSDARQHFVTYYDHCRVVPFPETCRKFSEVVVWPTNASHRRQIRTIPRHRLGSRFRLSANSSIGSRPVQPHGTSRRSNRLIRNCTTW